MNFCQHQNKKRTLSCESMPQDTECYAECNRFLYKSHKKISKGSLRHHKTFTILVSSGLALFMGVGTLCGVLIAPMGANASVGGGGAELIAQEKLLAGTGLGLDPQNDPVVFTTDYGLEIKYANALTNSNLAGYTYFEAGGFNWVIIGYDPSLSAFVGEYSGDTYQRNPIQGNNTVSSTIDDSPAGIAIFKENFAISSLAKPNEEIGDGCVLCFNEIGLGQVSFHSSSNVYSSSNLRTFLKDTIYGGNSGLSLALQALPIEPQTLVTAGNADITDHLFPLGSNYHNANESFAFENYMDLETALAVSGDDRWWTRSRSNKGSQYMLYVTDSGYGYYGTVYETQQARPAFVLKI